MSAARTLAHRARSLGLLAAILSVAGLVLVYPPLRLAGLLTPGWSPSLWQAVLLFALPMLIRLFHHRGDAAWARAASAVILTWLGICFVLLSLLVPAELVLLSGMVEPKTTGLVVLALLGIICAYSFYNAQRLHIHTVDINAPSHLRGRRFAQISDVHIGSRQPGFLRPVVDKVNRLQADYVLITGDLIDMANISEADLAPLAELQAPTLFCIGNHERYVDLEQICRRLANLGIRVLRNAELRTNDVQFIGIDDAEQKDQVRRQLAAIPKAEDAYRVLLYHRPDGAEDAADWGVNLMLTGHTHRGQIFPFNLLVKRTFPQLYRSYRFGDMDLYVSPGTGTWGPVMRLGSKCEVTQFRLL